MPGRSGWPRVNQTWLPSWCQQHRGKSTETATTKLRCAFFNPQSLKKKSYLIEHDLDIIGLCETWLCGDESDKIFIKGLTPDGYQFYNVPRRHSRGGGVGLLAKSSIHLEVQECFSYTHMEGMEILADTGSLKLRMAIINRPPPSTENGLTVAGFLDHFSNFMEGYISNNEKLLMMGDFNFHVGDVADTTAK